MIRPNVFIAAMGRSGSTMLANKLTVNPGAVCFIEPNLVKGGNRALIRGFRTVGVDFSERPDLVYLNRLYEKNPAVYKKELFKKLSGIDFWGFKEVEGDYFIPSVEFFNPVKVIVLVRDVKQVFFSFYEKSLKQNRLEEWGVDWICRKIKKTAACQVELMEKYPGRVIAVNYNNLLDENFLENVFFKKIGFNYSVKGDPNANFEQYNRSWEIGRNLNREKVDLSVSDRGLPEGLNIIADNLESELSSYRSRFFL